MSIVRTVIQKRLKLRFGSCYCDKPVTVVMGSITHDKVARWLNSDEKWKNPPNTTKNARSERDSLKFQMRFEIPNHN